MRVCFACWAIPLGLGILALAAALASHRGANTTVPFGDLMLLDVFIGIVLAGLGWIAALCSVANPWLLNDERWREAIKPAIVAGLLLTSNMCLAALVISEFG